jgi:hypothetical protein
VTRQTVFPHAAAVASAAAHRRAHRRALLAIAAGLVAAAVCLLATRPAHAQAPATPAARTAAADANAAAPARGSARRAPAADAARRDSAAVVVIERESFAYASNGRRDPFKSLLTTSDLRPLLAELRLVGVAVDPEGRNSVAILRDLTTKAQHRVRVGQLLGRMRVAQIRPRAVVFTIEELGFSRQETLGLADSTVARSK